jgi:hypothetical protein
MVKWYESSLPAYGAAIDLLPQLVVQSEIQARQETLSRASNLACGCASVCIKQGVPELAVEFLEEGRGTFWSRALQPRSDLTGLRSMAPGMADRITTISSLLEDEALHDITRRVSIQRTGAPGAPSRLDDTWEQYLDEARQRSLSEDFMHPHSRRKSFAELQPSALQGPVVMLNASEWACDGLIITMEGVKHVPFPDLSPQDLKALGAMLRVALNPASGSAHAETEDASATQETFESLVEKLRDTDYGQRHVRPSVRKGDLEESEALFRKILHALWVFVAEPIIQTLCLQVRLARWVSDSCKIDSLV